MISLTNTDVSATGGDAFASLNTFGVTPNQLVVMTGGHLTSDTGVAISAQGRLNADLSGGANVRAPFVIATFGQSGVGQLPTVATVTARACFSTLEEVTPSAQSNSALNLNSDGGVPS